MWATVASSGGTSTSSRAARMAPSSSSIGSGSACRRIPMCYTIAPPVWQRLFPEPMFGYVRCQRSGGRSMEQHAVVVGGGIGGLSAALALGRAGHRVTVLEQDPLPATADAEEAFVAERRGAPQVHQTHGFLARLVVVLRERFPDVL